MYINIYDTCNNNLFLYDNKTPLSVYLSEKKKVSLNVLFLFVGNVHGYNIVKITRSKETYLVYK